jgi:hypothetical protein
LLNFCLQFFWSCFSSRRWRQLSREAFFLWLKDCLELRLILRKLFGSRFGLLFNHPLQILAAVLAEFLFGTIWETTVWTLTRSGDLFIIGGGAGDRWPGYRLWCWFFNRSFRRALGLGDWWRNGCWR